MRFHAIYRSAPGENRKNRPGFYSKDLALRSFLTALEELPDGDRVFVNDGALADDRTTLMEKAGEVIHLPSVGNARSYRACVGLVNERAWDDDDIVYFAEDDYLHTGDAFRRLAAAVAAIPGADYFTLYDSPDYDRLRRHRLFQARHRHSVPVEDITWRQVQTTCLTYGARVGALRADSWVHYLCSRSGVPLDYAIWSIVVGGGGFFTARAMKATHRLDDQQVLRANVVQALRLRPRRGGRLMAARPGLAAHMEDGLMGDGDWTSVAHGLPLSASDGEGSAI